LHVPESEPLWQAGRGFVVRDLPCPSSLLDTRVVYCGDNLEQLAKLPDGPCRTGQCWGETKEQRAFADRHESTRCVILKATAGERNVAPMNWHW
jgi:hypothetical protein